MHKLWKKQCIAKIKNHEILRYMYADKKICAIVQYYEHVA